MEGMVNNVQGYWLIIDYHWKDEFISLQLLLFNDALHCKN